MSTDLRARLQDADPAAGLPAYDPERCESVVSAILSDDGAGGRTRGLVRSTRRRVAVAGVLAAACVGVVAVGIWPVSGASAQASNLLTTAESRFADPPARDDQYWRVTRDSLDRDGVRRVRTEYVAVDGTRPTYHVDDTYASKTQAVPTATSNGRAVWVMNLTPKQIPGGWQVPTAAFLATLPADPGALRDRLYRDSEGRGNSVDGEAFVYVADLLRDGTLPAVVTRRMYALLRTIPGVDVLPDPTTVDGKTGTVLVYNHGTILGDQQLLIDPHTGALIAEKNGSQPWGGIERTLVDTVPADVTSVAVHVICDTMNGQGIACTEATPR